MNIIYGFFYDDKDGDDGGVSFMVSHHHDEVASSDGEYIRT